MKTLITTFFLALIYCCAFTQSKLELEAIADGNDREMMTVSNLANDNLTSTRFSIYSARGSSNESGTYLSSFSGGYIATAGYTSFGLLANDDSGLLIRANGSMGRINFMTASNDVLNGTRMSIAPDGLVKVHSNDLRIENATSGLILTSPNGTCYRLQVSNTGVITTTALPQCP